MKLIVTLALVAALSLGLAALASDSKAADSGNLPPGTYKQTCRNIELTDEGLRAVCEKMNGEWLNTFIPASEMACPNGIENLDGELVCPRG